MNSLSELINYCSIDNPVGALLLTGEWGCGKTFLIDHSLEEKLKSSHIIIRISMFGISSIEDLNSLVKREWIHSSGGILDKTLGIGKLKSFLEKMSTLIPDEPLKAIITGALSLNYYDLINVENKIDGKKVVLVFDDLERCDIPSKEKLGVINEYCENKGFNVIIVADEKHIADKEYQEFKEKVVQRTVYHEPDYSVIVKDIFGAVKEGSFKDLLTGNVTEIAALLAGKDTEGNRLEKSSCVDNRNMLNIYDREGINGKERKNYLIDHRPHNIRSFKAALQDFERVFQLLNDKNVDDLNKWLYTFLAFSLASKANLIQKNNKYGSLFYEYEMNILYPGFFDAEYMPDLLSQWILNGAWDETALIDYLDERYSVQSDPTPKDLVKSSRIDYLDENIVRTGFPEVIKDAYDGDLTLNEYVIFIENARLIRTYDVFDLDIVWGKVCEGINRRIEKNIQNREGREYFQTVINNLEDYSEGESKAYNIILDYRQNSIGMFEVNKREYIAEMRNNPESVYTKISTLRFNSFDQEMADATFEAFRSLDNRARQQFCDYFEGIWHNYRQSFDIKPEGVQKSEASFTYLKEKLQGLKEEYRDYPFKKMYVEKFITTIDTILSRD